jgi:hypothetical protein
MDRRYVVEPIEGLAESLPSFVVFVRNLGMRGQRDAHVLAVARANEEDAMPHLRDPVVRHVDEVENAVVLGRLKFVEDKPKGRAELFIEGERRVAWAALGQRAVSYGGRQDAANLLHHEKSRLGFIHDSQELSEKRAARVVE